MKQQPKRVFCIDNDIDLLLVYKKALKLDGHEVELAAGPIDVIGTIMRFRPDVIILDYSMPLANGVIIRDQIGNTFPGIPVMLCTGRQDLLEHCTDALPSGHSYAKENAAEAKLFCEVFNFDAYVSKGWKDFLPVLRRRVNEL